MGRTFIIGILLNSLFVIVQIIAGFLTHSMSLLADAGHNLGDVAGLLLSFFAIKMAKVKATQQYTYGYKKTTILAALGNAVILLLSVGLLGVESVRRLMAPQHVEGGVMAVVAGLGIVINFGSALLFLSNKEHELNSRGAYLHLMSDALVSLGVVVAGVIIAFRHWYWLDGVVSIIILLVILVGTWSLLTQSFRLSVDAVPPGISKEEIEKAVLGMEGVEDIHHVHIWAMSTTENALTTHLVLDAKLAFEAKLALVSNIKHELLHLNIHHATIELESSATPCINGDC